MPILLPVNCEKTNLFFMERDLDPPSPTDRAWAGFVDLRKAFDCIPRQKLFDKLGKEGVQGLFLDVLISMYSNDKSAVKVDNKLTEVLTCFAGVKQGCMM